MHDASVVSNRCSMQVMGRSSTILNKHMDIEVELFVSCTLKWAWIFLAFYSERLREFASLHTFTFALLTHRQHWKQPRYIHSYKLKDLIIGTTTILILKYSTVELHLTKMRFILGIPCEYLNKETFTMARHFTNKWRSSRFREVVPRPIISNPYIIFTVVIIVVRFTDVPVCIAHPRAIHPFESLILLGIIQSNPQRTYIGGVAVSTGKPVVVDEVLFLSRMYRS